jgi:transposase
MTSAWIGCIWPAAVPTCANQSTVWPSSSREGFDLDPFSSALFVFCNRKRDKLKILHWEHNGFWLYYRRLERGRFQWPAETAASTMAVTRRELRWLLDGLSLEQRRAHRSVAAWTVI